MSKINLQRGILTVDYRRSREKKRICSEVSVNSQGIRGVSPGEEKAGYDGKDLQKRKVLSLEWKSEGVMDDESGESMEPMEEVPLMQLGEAELERLVRDWRRGACTSTSVPSTSTSTTVQYL